MMHDYVFLDLVTDDEGHPTSIAAIRAKDNVVQAAFSSEIADNYKMIVRSFKSAVIPDRLGNGFIVVSWNAQIDRVLLKREHEKYELGEEIFSGRAWLDVSQLSWPLVFAELIQTRGLSSVAQYFEVDPKMSDSEDRCATLMRTFHTMMQRYRTALIGENVITDIGGDMLKGMRRMVGF